MAAKFAHQWVKLYEQLRTFLTVFTKIFTEKSCILSTIKCVLGVHSKSSNLACVGELNRFPVYMDVCNDILKYYFYASQETDDSLIGQTLQTSKHLHEKGTKSWYTGVNTILTEMNLNETNCNPAKDVLQLSRFCAHDGSGWNFCGS